jgi:cell wall-associated protease
MNFGRTALSLSLVLSMSVGSFIASARAGLPESPQTASDPYGFTSTLLKINQLDQASRAELFNVKNKKGESIFAAASAEQKDQWALLDPNDDQVEGTSTNKLYKNNKISPDKNDVVVAVIDTGVDIHHEDLKGHIWLNLPEFVGKLGVDDDNDGYIDDIYGWNFLGNQDGTSVAASTLEVTRIYKSLSAQIAAGQSLNVTDTALLAQVTQEYDQGLSEAQTGYALFQSYSAALTLLKANGLKTETLAGLSAVTSNDPSVLQALQIAKIIFTTNKTSADVNQALVYFKTEIDFNYSLTFDSSQIVKDNPAVMDDIGYGNGDVMGPDATHGTHVAGIIAANRQNNIGINGQGLNVKIMSLRVVPNGDERDKDVANAIHFAVDHGARIINMSFGKDFSPNKNYVDTAMKYAESMGVLIVHAAGNDGRDTSLHPHFPTRQISLSPGITRDIETWIEVGASDRTRGANLPASFSNYGKTTVDVFAPGVGIVSTVPGNQYAALSGTSMAAPEVTGVAAILMEAYPNSTADEVKTSILSSTNQYPGLSCNQPGKPASAIAFSDLSMSGGTVNANQAIQRMQTATLR